MSLKSNQVLTEEAVRDQVEAITQENLMFRQAFKPLDATGIDNDVLQVPKPDDTIGNPKAIPEGAEFPRDEEEFTKIPIDFQKYGFEVAITREAMQDSMLDIAADHVERQSRQMAEFLNEVAYEELNNNLHSENTAGGLGDSSKLEYEDIIDAQNVLRTDHFSPNLLVVNVQGEADLLTSDQFLRATELGDRTVTTGAIGRVAGLDVVVSDAGHIDNTTGAGFVVDTSFYGYEAVREDIMTEQYDAPERQANMMQIFTRRGFKAIEPEAAIKVVA